MCVAWQIEWETEKVRKTRPSPFSLAQMGSIIPSELRDLAEKLIVRYYFLSLLAGLAGVSRRFVEWAPRRAATFATCLGRENSMSLPISTLSSYYYDGLQSQVDETSNHKHKAFWSIVKFQTIKKRIMKRLKIILHILKEHSSNTRCWISLLVLWWGAFWPTPYSSNSLAAKTKSLWTQRRNFCGKCREVAQGYVKTPHRGGSGVLPELKKGIWGASSRKFWKL